MKIEVDEKSGFCFGVQNAVDTAEKALLNGEKIYSLGSIVHNDAEVERLAALGLISVTREQFKGLKNATVLIRAHGEPPETYETARNNNITIIDATCPIVKRLQLKIKKAWLESKSTGGQVVIFGKPGHAEVIGLSGQTANEAIQISDESGLSHIDFSKPVHLFSQTTMHLDDYKAIADAIYSEMKKKGIIDPDRHLVVHQTICGQVSHREPHLRRFAAEHDVILFVSGKESSNGKMLYAVCKSVNPRTFFISSVSEIDKSWFRNTDSIGVCGATSTPRWLMKDVHNYLSNL